MNTKLTELAKACFNGACNPIAIINALRLAILDMEQDEIRKSLEIKIIVRQLSYLSNNNMNTKPFTIEDGLAIQSQGIAEWMPRLSSKCFYALLDERDKQNREAKDVYGTPWRNGYDVWRGQDISSFVANWKE
jgi:hypothetical protein